MHNTTAKREQLLHTFLLFLSSHLRV